MSNHEAKEMAATGCMRHYLVREDTSHPREPEQGFIYWTTAGMLFYTHKDSPRDRSFLRLSGKCTAHCSSLRVWWIQQKDGIIIIMFVLMVVNRNGKLKILENDNRYKVTYETISHVSVLHQIVKDIYKILKSSKEGLIVWEMSRHASNMATETQAGRLTR